MDGENNGKPYEQMDDLGGFPIILGNTHILALYLLLPFLGLDTKCFDGGTPGKRKNFGPGNLDL